MAGHDVNVPATNAWPEALQPVNRRDVLNALILTSAGPVPAGLPAGSLSVSALPQRDNLNNTPQFQAAIDTLRRAGGGTLFVPPGTYRIRELRITSSVSLVGLGHAAFKLFDPGRDGYLVRIIGQSAISIRNLRFDCTVEAGRENTVGCLEVTFDGEVASSNIAISDCVFANAQNNAWLILRKADNVLIENCEFLDHLRETPGGTHGLSIAESSSAVRVVDCRFDHPSGYRSRYLSRGHVGIDRATDIWIERCILRRAPLNGITIEDNEESLSQSVTIRDCAIRDCGNSAVQIEGNGLVNLSVHNCDIASNGSYGVRLASGKDLIAHITSCNFTNNGRGDLTSGSSQLHINLEPAHIAIVQNCVFKSSSNDSDFAHIFYLNGEASVTGCSFVGSVNGYGIYSPIDREKQLQRMTATFKSLRFIGVGTATFNIPQHSGCSWQYGKREQQSIETLLSKTFACNRDYPAIDIWTPVHARTDAGEMSISVNALTGGSMGAKAMHFDLTVERTTDGSIRISPVSRREDASIKRSEDQSYSMQIVANSIAEEHAFRSRLIMRVIADTASCTSDVSVLLLIRVIWNGFSSSPLFI